MSGTSGSHASLAIFGVFAAAATISAPVMAQDTPGETAEDAFARGAVYLEADEILTDETSARYIARGAVEARYGARIVRADEVIYEPDTGRVVARGNVVVVQEDGSATFAQEIELTNDLSEGVIESFSARLANQGTLAAAYAVRGADGVNELDGAYYTACKACTASGSPTRPSWKLRARRVTQDGAEGMIRYRDAVLEVKGFPVLYVPYFAHPDPSTPKKSGFLFPSVGESSKTGTFVDAPYYWAIGDSQDMTVTPRVMSNAAPLVSFEHRRSFFSGRTQFQGSITQEREFDQDGAKFGDRSVRGHLFGEGIFQLADNWVWGFGVETVGDDLFFERYEIDDTAKRRGLYSRADKRLLSQLYAVRHTKNTYASGAVLRFQGLRAGDEDGQIPFVGPLAEARHVFKEKYLGGRVEARASMAAIGRSEGVDSTRVTTELDWSRRGVAPIGLVATPFAFARADLYDVRDFTTDSGDPVDESFGRLLGYAGAELSYPLGRRAGGVDLLVEPVASVVYAPDGGNDERIPVQDAVLFDFDEASFLDANRAPGYDVWEDGARATVGGRAIAQWSASREISVFLGQSYRSESSKLLGPSSGLDGTTSDFVGAARFALSRNNSIGARFRLNDEDYDIERLDVDARSRIGPAYLTTRYLRLDDDAVTGLAREELSVSTGVEFTRNFGAYYEANRDLEADEMRASFLGLVYRDDCTRVELVYKRENTLDRTIGESSSIKLQVTLATLGSLGKRR